jgi:hypothetical protein
MHSIIYWVDKPSMLLEVAVQILDSDALTHHTGHCIAI